MRWPWSKRRPMSDETWRVGDLAECIVPISVWRIAWPDNPEAGEIRRVSALNQEPGGLYLALDGSWPRTWEAVAFRKIVHKHEPAEAWFTRLVRERRREPVIAAIEDKGRVRFVPR